METVFVPRSSEEATRADEEFRPAWISSPEGVHYIPVFTSIERLDALFPAETGYMQISADDLLSGWPAEVDAVIDAASPDERIVEAEGLAAELGGGPGPRTVPAGTRVAVGDPVEEPTAALRAVERVCRAAGAVVTAYRAQVAIDAPGERPHLAIGIVLDPDADFGEIAKQIGDVAAAELAGPVSVVPVDPAAPEEAIASYMLAETHPIFAR